MKNPISIILTISLAITVLYAQVPPVPPQAFNYTGFATDKKGHEVRNKRISIRASILDEGFNGMVWYAETHGEVVTDNRGLFSIKVGEGTPISGTFSTIPWAEAPMQLLIEIDPKGKSKYQPVGIVELSSVPYALYAGSAGDVDDADPDPENELQELEYDPSTNTLGITEGNNVDLGLLDDPTDEIQDLHLDGTTLRITNNLSATPIDLSPLVNQEGQYYFGDMDTDQFGNAFNPVWVPTNVDPPSYFIIESTDCDDKNAAINPNAEEVFDQIDNNCDGQIDESSGECLFGAEESMPCDSEDSDFCENGIQTRSCLVSNTWGDWSDCIEDGGSFEEICGDDIDQDCDGGDLPCSCIPGDPCDDGIACTQGDYYDENCNCVPGTPNNNYCDDGRPCSNSYCDPELGCVTEILGPDVICTAGDDACQEPSVCDGMSPDCPAIVEINCDDGDPTTLDECDPVLGCIHTFIDGDEDGYNMLEDCDDTDDTIHPGATEILDGVDNDCDGFIDNYIDLGGDNGVPIDGFPNWEEQMILVLTNRARCDPDAALVNCITCADVNGGCYSVAPPLEWDFTLNKLARFHAINLTSSGCGMSHDSPCQLIATIGTDFPDTRDGSVSSSCVGGIETCASGVNTSYSERFSLFGISGFRSENIVSNGDPKARFNLWLLEESTDPSCDFNFQSGHRRNILNPQSNRLGVGASGGYIVQDFWRNGSLDAKIPSGSHWPKNGGGNTEFRVNWYDPAGGEPYEAKINIDGVWFDMNVEIGTGGNATYLLTTNISGISWYYFRFKDSNGAIVTYPGTGAYGVGSVEFWRDSRP